MHSLTRGQREYYGGALVALLGLCAFVGGVRFHIGTPAHMGPGFFPTAVGALLVLIGLGIVLTARTERQEATQEASVDLRVWGCILGGLVAFAILGQFGGLVPATFAVVFISALADRRSSLRETLPLAVVLVIISVVVFWWALRLQFPLFRWG